MKQRTPLKGKPNFSSVSNERMRDYLDLVQQLIFSYEHCDVDKARVLTEIWHELSEECTERLCNAPFVEPKEEVAPSVHKIKMVKPIKRIKR